MDRESSCAPDDWLGRFVQHMQGLQPLLSGAQCMDLATAAFESSHDLEPEDAAVVFSEILDASVPLNDLNRGFLKAAK